MDVLRNSRTELRLTDIAGAAKLDISTTFRLLRTLEGRGYVLRDRKTRRFKLRWGYRTYRIGYAQLASDQPFPQKVTHGLMEAAEKARVELLVADNRNDPETAVKNAGWLIDQGVDFVIEYQFHYRVGPVLANMFAKARIPTLAIDIPQPGAIYFGIDNYAAGFAGGEILARYAQASWSGHLGHVLLLELPEAGPVPHARALGTLAGIESIRGRLTEKSILHRNGKGTEAGGYASTRRALAALGNRAHLLIAAANDNSARGALRAIREAHREKSTAVFAQGMDPDEFQEEVNRGGSPLIGAAAYFPEKYGSQILPIVLQCLNGQPVTPAVYAEHRLITRDGIPTRWSAQTT